MKHNFKVPRVKCLLREVSVMDRYVNQSDMVGLGVCIVQVIWYCGIYIVIFNLYHVLTLLRVSFLFKLVSLMENVFELVSREINSEWFLCFCNKLKFYKCKSMLVDHRSILY